MTDTQKEIHLQVDMMSYLTQRWGKTFAEFFDLDEKYGILRLLRVGYEPYHLTGDEGIALEVESHIRECGGSI
jgi:hypothetical protein